MLTINLTDKKATGSIDKSEVHQILSNERRRTMLKLIAQHGPMSKRELTDRMAEIEHGDYTSDERKAVLVSIHQIHLPRLTEANVLTHTDLISKGENFEEVSQYLETETKAWWFF